MAEQRQSVRQAAAAGRGGNGGDDGGAQPAALKKLDDDVRGARDYLASIVPAHVNANQYVAIVIGALHKDRYLAEAALRNPGSLMAALAEGARLGLVPGDGFALVPFKRSEGEGGPRIPVITPVTEYTGELQLMYNTGRVEAVVCEVAHEHDTYIRGKHPHDPPVFVKGGALDPPGTDKPFAAGGTPRNPDAGPRGAPIGAFGYAVLMSGGISRVVEMGRDEIMLHRDAAPSKKVWDGDFWRSQWLKTIIHEMYKWVPKSPEFAADLMRASAAAARVPAGVVMGQLERPMLEPGDTEMGALPAAAPPPAAMGTPAPAGERDPVPGRAEPGGQRGQRQRGKAAGADGNAPADQERLDLIGELLTGIGVEGDDGLRVVAVLGGSAVGGDGRVPLTNDQAATVAGHLRAVIAQGSTDTPAVVLLWERVAGAEHAAGAAVRGQAGPDGEGHGADAP
jgi:recombination protein RecT